MKLKLRTRPSKPRPLLTTHALELPSNNQKKEIIFVDIDIIELRVYYH